MNKDKIKTIRDIVEYSIDLAVKRFDGSSLHVESIMNEVMKDKSIYNIRTGSVTEIDLFMRYKDRVKVTLSDLVKNAPKVNKVVKKQPQITGKISSYTASEKERIHKSLKSMNPKKRNDEIKKLYTYKDPKSLNSLERRVLEIISKIHEVGVETILSKYRGIEAVEARMQYMVLLYDLFGYTTVEVGRTLVRDHSTVIHAKDSHQTILEIKQNKAYIDNFNRVLIDLEKEFPAFFNIDEDRVEKIQRKYRNAAKYSKERRHKIIGELKLSDLILKDLEEKDGKIAKTN